MIVGIFGNLSSGKTVFAVKLLADEYVKRKAKIISNIYLQFPYTRLDLNEMIFKAKTDSHFFFDSYLFLDEIHNIVDARRSSSDLNQKFTQFLTQLGKLNCNLIFTSQIFTSQIDLRLRELCDILCFCTRIDDKGNPLVLSPRIVDKKVFISVVMYVKTYGGMQYLSTQFNFDPTNYFDLYKTREVVLLDRDRYLKSYN